LELKYINKNNIKTYNTLGGFVTFNHATGEENTG